MKDVHVIIAAVPWRRAGLINLLRTVQDVDVGSITLIPDQGLNGRDVLLEAGVDAEVCAVQEGLAGHGQRWLVAETSKHPYVSILDDDVTLEPEYFSNAVRMLREHQAADVVTFSGRDERNQFLGPSFRASKPLRMPIVGSATATLRPEILLGLKSNFSEHLVKFLSRTGCDETLLSYWFWKNHLTVVRPPGPSYLKFTKDHTDPRSLSSNWRERRAPLERELMALGWPGVTARTWSRTSFGGAARLWRR